MNFIRTRVLPPDGWTPASEVHHAATLFAGRLPRESRYSNGGTGQSVFDYSPPIDPSPHSFEYAITIAGRILIAAMVAVIVGLIAYYWTIF